MLTNCTWKRQEYGTRMMNHQWRSHLPRQSWSKTRSNLGTGRNPQIQCLATAELKPFWAIRDATSRRTSLPTHPGGPLSHPMLGRQRSAWQTDSDRYDRCRRIPRILEFDRVWGCPLLQFVQQGETRISKADSRPSGQLAPLRLSSFYVS